MNILEKLVLKDQKGVLRLRILYLLCSHPKRIWDHSEHFGDLVVESRIRLL